MIEFGVLFFILCHFYRLTFGVKYFIIEFGVFILIKRLVQFFHLNVWCGFFCTILHAVSV